MARQKREWKRKAKDARKNNKLWAEGAREGLMRPHIEAYADVLERGWRSERDYVLKVCNEYHGRISWRLQDHEEPELPLPKYDPLAPPVVEDLTDEEKKAKHDRINVLNARIRRWLKYRARSLRKNIGKKRADAEYPYAVLLAKLSGVTTPPKARQGYQQFMHEAYATVIAPVVEARWNAQAVGEDGEVTAKKPNAPFRGKIARELFAEMSDKEQTAYRDCAVAEARSTKAKYEKWMKSGPSKAPADRQECINNLGRFMTPVLRGLQEYTGLQGFLVMGGPMPKYNGEIGTVHMSVGLNLAAAPVHFPAWDKVRFAKDILGFTKEYLHTTYTKDQCTEAALPTVASLDDAKFQIEGEDSPNNDSDDDDSDSELESSESGSSDSDDEDDEDESGSETEGRKGKKKQKAAKAGEKRKQGKENRQPSSRAAKKSRAEVEEEERRACGREANALREANIAKNAKLLEEMGL
ncbi:hypothetical protein FB451DRAFT_1394307 [Mycena latifolia]|nr:hypothetical protein FB451DRAFT_1394307 [Mycena latifolia]